MIDESGGNGRIRVRYFSRDESLARYSERIRYCEEKYGMSSAAMRELVSTGDDRWETLEILKWMSADRAYQSLLEDEIPMDGKAGTITGRSMNEG